MGNGNNLPTVRTFATKMNSRLEQKREQIARVLPAHIDVDRFMDVARTAIVENGKDLRKCDPDSLYMAFRRCAAAGLMPDGDESTIVRYKDQAQFMPMVKGVIRQMLRAPDVAKVESRVVREDVDRFAFSHGLRPQLEHQPGPVPEEAKDDFDPTISHAYAIVYWEHLSAEQATFEVVPRADIERARRTSRASNSPAWRNWYGEMARKVSLHRVSKYVDLAPEAARAIRADIAAGWDADAEPSGTDLSVAERLEEQTRRETDDLKRRLTGSDDDAGGDGGEPPAGRPDLSWEADSRLPDGYEKHVRSGWWLIRDPSGEILNPDDRVRPNGAVDLANDHARRTGRAPAPGEQANGPSDDESGAESGPESETGGSAGGDDEDGERAAESAKRQQFLDALERFERGDVVDAAEFMFGGRDDVERTAAGFVDLESLTASELSRLVSYLADDEDENGGDESDG